MYTAGELEKASMALDKPMKGLETRIMSDIVRRIKENGDITSAADWQITRLVQLGVSMKDIQRYINEALTESENICDVLFPNVIKEGYVRDKKLYEAVDKVQIPFEENEPLQQLIGAVTAQTNETMQNVTQSLGFAQRGADGKIHFTELADYYQKTLDNAMLDISSGAFDYNTVLKRTVKEMTNSGLRTVDYATGWSNRVDVAARRAVMTGMTQLTAQVNEQNAEQLDTEWFEISWHSGARPSHWWGGKWYTKEQLTTICGLGDVQGLCGANCYHDYSPVIPGISEPTYTQEELDELNRKEKEKVEWSGKEYTKYEATQRQRQLETTMRAQREEMKLLQEGGASEDDLINCRARYMGTSHEYAEFSKAMGLPQQRERVYADGLGNIMEGKTEGGSGKESPIKVPPVGAKVTDKVTAEERKELLSRNPVNVHNSSVDKSAQSGIIKTENLKMSADTGFTLGEKQYEVKEDKKQVEDSYKYAKEVLGAGNVKFDKLKNNEVIQPMLEQVNNLKAKHKKSFSQIFVDDTMSDADFAMVSPDLSLHLNAKYMNSAEATADFIARMEKQKLLPKGFENTDYLITHEYMHYISRSEVDNPRAKVHKVIPDETKMLKNAPSKNSLLSKNEYVADSMAMIEVSSINDYSESKWNSWLKIYNYFFN